MWKKVLAGILSVAVVLVELSAVQKLVVPKYMDNVLEGAFTQEYYKETTKHDVIFVGDCEVYENFSPIELWNDYGITSYIRGNAQQLIWQSYYMLEDTLRYEKPKVVVYNVQSLTHNTPQKEEYNRMTIDGMKWSKYKYQNIKASMMPEENMLDYVFPLLRYHSRITELTKSDITYYNKKKKVTHNGYYMRVDALAYNEDTALEEDKPKNTKFGSNAMKYMDMMRDLCKKNNIKLVLVKAPSLSPKWFDEYEQQVEEYASKNNNDGKVTAKNKGVAIITITKGKVKKQITVNVKTSQKHTSINTLPEELKISKPMIIYSDKSTDVLYHVTNKGSGPMIKVTAQYTVTVTKSKPVTGSAVTSESSSQKKYNFKSAFNKISKGKQVELKSSLVLSDNSDIKSAVLNKIIYHSGESKITYYPKTGKWSASRSNIDVKAPVISGLVGDNAYNKHYKDVVRTVYKENKSWLLKYVSAKDEHDGKVKVTVDTSKIKWNKKGIYTVTYYAKDKAGNTASVKTKVAVRKSSDSYDRYASSILKNITKQSWSDEKKARAIYKYVRGKMAYIDSNDHKSWERSSVYALRYNSGNCFCFYSLSRLLLTRCGIPNQTVTRYRGHAGHWWNFVYVRGGWYHFDTTPRRIQGWFCLWTDSQLTAYSNRAGHSHIWNHSWVPASSKKKIS